jgi:hypothetical protein
MYTTAELDTIIKKLEMGLASSFAEIEFQSRRTTYRSTGAILNAIAYFKSLYSTATDAPTTSTKKVRTLLFYGSKGFGI